MDNIKPTNLTEEKQYVSATPLQSTAKKKPDDVSGIYLDAKFMITDPKTGEVLVKGRA